MKHITPINKENIIYLGLWTLLFLSPIASLHFHSVNTDTDHFMWRQVFHVWLIFAACLAIFLVHNFMLAPLLIYRHKTKIYLAATVCLLGVFAVFQYFNRPDTRRGPGKAPKTSAYRHACPRNNGQTYPEHLERDAEWGSHATPKPYHGPDDRTAAPIPNPTDKAIDSNCPDGLRQKRGERHQPPLIIGQADFIGVIVLIGLLGINLGIKLYFKNEEDQDNMQKLEKENLQQQLEYLKFQINPHFFMNTLNNIHALVDINSEKAKTSIVELSKMMRYVLYEGNKSIISLQKETEFLHNYIRLMQLRYNDKVKTRLDIPGNLPDGQIPPLLLITFVENSFKHGVSYQQDCFINISLNVDDGQIIFQCANRKLQKESDTTGSMPEEGGVGLKNVQQRLRLIYGDKYIMNIKDNEEIYSVELILPLMPKESKNGDSTT